MAAAYGGFLGWLYAGWRQEAAARALATSTHDHLKSRSIVPPALSWLLVGTCRQWQQRIDDIFIYAHPLTSAEIQAIADCRHVRALFLYAVPLTADDVVVICRCQELESLGLVGAGLHGEELGPLAHLVRLRKLWLHYNRGLGDAALPKIATLTDLEFLSLNDTAVTDEGLMRLADMRNLKTLYLFGCKGLTNAAVSPLSRFTWLEALSVGDTALTPDAAARLHTALQACKITYP